MAAAKGTRRANGTRGPARPKAAGGSRARATSKAAAKPKPPTAQAKPRTPAPPDVPAAHPTAAPEPERPAGLRLAAAAQASEAVGLCVAGVLAALSTADGRSYQLASGIVLTLIAFGTAAALAAVAVGLARARPWSRVPAVMTQLFAVIAGVTLLDGRRPEWGVPALALAAACVAGLLTPASLRALNRPSAKSQ